ncbi:MAG: carboxyl transferase domain-containing protein [Elusimicrobiota bacterium]|nr:carboxyl transferase domain-containing protein [Elusimicrobiota bacterium]
MSPLKPGGNKKTEPLTTPAAAFPSDTPAIHTSYTASSPEAVANSLYHQALLKDLRARISEVSRGGSEKSVLLHRKRNKLTARERIAKLVAPGEPWFEFSPLAAFGMHDNEVPSAGIVTGAARIGGRWCVIIANDATVKGGTYYPETIKKHLRAQEIARENRLPTLYLADSGGVFLPKQSEVFADKEAFGRIFYNQAVMSALGIPQVSAVMGMCTAGGAYLPAMSDENIIVRGVGTIYLGGPPLVKAATGEDSTEEELGGGEMHSTVSGVTDHLANSDEHALRLVRSVVDNLNTPKSCAPAGYEEPLYPAEDLYGIINRDSRRPADVKQIVARLVDGSRFHEFKAVYGRTLVCGFARWLGHPVGIIGNQGILFSESALKGAHFIELCGQRKIPLIFLQNITGFMVGKQFEQGGIIKHGAKLVQAVSTVAVPKITVIIGSSHGAGNYAMCGRAYGARFLFTWPNSRVSVMGAAQAAGVMVTIKRAKLEQEGKSLSAQEADAIKKPILEQYERESHPYYGTGKLWDDGIIEPALTRQAIGWCLEMTSLSEVPGAHPRYPVFRM